ncbi:MAG: hypothetical protein KTR35_07125 [Gammaproteobacteria bacterium]|nr:hypothetical protein [Gammaproteobacteria bacterium]
MNEEDKRLKAHYQNVQLNPDRLDRLVGITAEHAKKDSNWTTHRNAFMAFVISSTSSIGIRTVAATALMAVVAVWLYSAAANTERAQQTLKEVAMNHTTRLDLEYHGDSLVELDNSMHQLPFSLTLPNAVRGQYELVGSRYCSLAGQLAAHIKFRDIATGKPVSLFVSGNSKSLQKIPSQQTTLNGIDVDLWQEGGLFFAMASQS